MTVAAPTRQQQFDFSPMPLPSLPERPLVSVLIANLNYDRYLPLALDSLLSQTYDHWEAVICDDGSTDSSRDVIERYAARDQRIRCVFQPNGGQGSALNAAYLKSGGQIIALLDADDIFLPSKVEDTVNTMRRASNCGFALHFAVPISAQGDVIGAKMPYTLSQGWVAPSVLRRGGTHSGLPPASSLMFRREVTDVLFPIPSTFRSVADGYLRGLAQLVTEIVPIEKELSLYRLHSANLTGEASPTAQGFEKLLVAYRRVFDAQVEFVRRRYGTGPSDLLHFKELDEYWNYMLAIYLMGGAWPSFDPNATVEEALAGLPSHSLQLTWKMLLTLPRSVSRRLFTLWQGQYAAKRMLRPIAALLNLRQS
jgi:glycosyltransferase involved in cell wall biosynthesis